MESETMRKALRTGIIFLALNLLLAACAAPGKHPVMVTFPRYIAEKGENLNFNGVGTHPEGICRVRATDLLGAWVSSKSPEKDAFSFNDIDGKSCQGTFDGDIMPLFAQANLWSPGALSCRTCHGPDVQKTYGRLDLSSYNGILAGSGRASADASGDDILGGGEWEKANLFSVLTKGQMPPNSPKDFNPKGPIVYAGTGK